MEKTTTIHLPYAKNSLILPGFKYFEHQWSITGSTGSGKTALVDQLKPELDRLRGPHDPAYEFLSAGGIKRIEALKPRKGYPRGFRLAEKDDEPDMRAFTGWEVAHPKFDFDRACDQNTREFSAKDFRVCDGRLVHLFMLLAFKILIICQPRVRAKRRADKYQVSRLQAMSWINDRDDNDRRRYEVKYPGYNWNHDDYDLVIVNEGIPEKQLGQIAIEGQREWLKKLDSGLIVPDKRIITVRA